MQDSARIGRPYRPKEMSLVDLLSSLWSANQLRSHTALDLKVPLWVIWCIHASRIISYYISSNGAAGANGENMKLVSDYMALSGRTGDNASPETMAGYKYLVLGEDRQEKKMEKTRFRFLLEETRPEELITVDKVWTWSRDSPHGGGGARSNDDRLLGRHTDSDNKFKDVCLSFALYKLLRRRFYGVSMPEAKDQSSRRLVSDGILDNTNDPNYDRLFRVTEVELSFLHDFSYSRHAVVFARGFPYHRQVLSTYMIGAVLYLAYAVRDIPSISLAQDEKGRVARITHGVLVTHFLIFIVVFRELLEIWVYVMSQWSKVLVVCHYIRIKLKGSGGWLPRLHSRILEKVARILFRIIQRGQWNQEIQQHNLLMAAARFQKRNIRFVQLRSEVKTKIFESLKALIIQPAEENDSSDASTQMRNNAALMSYHGNAFADSEGSLPPLIEHFRDKLHGDTHKILAWHVATSLCQIHLLEEARRDQDDLYTLPTSSFGDPEGFAALWPHYNTAATLSNYCVHLVAVALLPDNGIVASKVLHAVRQEAWVAMRGCRTWKQTHDRLMSNAWAPDPTPDGTTIVKIGAQLAAELLTRYGGRDELWERLSKFWTGYLLYLSASTKASKHQIHLQGRGELTTHLWALLSHAGFLGPNNGHGQQLLDPVDLDSA
ncbi:hypothetical protein QYE76_064707 [Lolium multiflorum]|uniref:DUF4220 domain-containing protein n=1 Tax=Lolium multiflorum TaxID=4521 RepID=A0AAD8S9P9_LOLMU|nr:hypothetical protein QYE76_064707 [Lolium multiflorum]